MAKWRLVILGCALSGLATAGPAVALQFPNPINSAVQYGDFYSYSLPLLATIYDSIYGGGTGPGNPYYIPSTGDDINSATVVGTGTNSGPATTNYAGADNAYPTPTGPDNSTATFRFSTNIADPGGVADPGEVSPFTGDDPGTWDIRLSALNTFLNPNAGDRNDLMIYFNNNQTKSGGTTDENLYAWSLIKLVDDAGILPTLYFELANFHTNNDPTQYDYAYQYTVDSAGQAVNPVLDNGVVNDWINRATPGDFVLSGGQLTVCFDGTSQVIGVVPPLPACPSGTTRTTVLDHNLGRNQAAYAVTVPELNAILKDNQGPTSDRFGGYDVLQWYVKMADLNNGYEQIFLRAGEVLTPPPAVVPEPETMLLLGSGLLGLAGAVRQRATRKK